MKRQQVCGAQKWKQAEEKKQKIEAVAQKLPKTHIIFSIIYQGAPRLSSA